MARLDFHVDYNIEIPHLEEELVAEAEQRMWLLAEEHTDLIGASVAVEELAQGDVYFLYQARVVVYIRPENIVAIEKAESVEAALTGAVKAIERQVRERRERLGATWQRPGKVTDQGVYELNAREIYDTYSDQIAQTDLNNLDRNAIASKLVLNEGLDEETAYYVADQILHFSQERQVKDTADYEPAGNQIPAEKVNPGIFTILDNLVQTCKASENDLRIAAQNVRDQELGRLLEEYARMYEQFIRALQNQAQRFDAESEPGGRVGLKRGWLNIKAPMTIKEENTDLLVLAATANSEAATLKIYREALDKGLPGELRSMVEHQLAEIEDMYDHISRINTRMEATD